MGICYRMKKRELVLLIDLLGDINALEQKFGDVYISREEYESIAESIHKKGFAMVCGEKIIPDRCISYIIKKMFDSELVLVCEDAGEWIYCSDEIIISVRFETEYRIRTAVSDEERRELSEDISGRKYVSVRGPECKIYGEKLAEIFEVVRVEK
ncbi:MAG: hypothetical protein ACI4KB_11965 [Oscillospiraceae bacterium]|nr:hypothetical protein [Oscillospiraceae bacterium]